MKPGATAQGQVDRDCHGHIDVAGGVYIPADETADPLDMSSRAATYVAEQHTSLDPIAWATAVALRCHTVGQQECPLSAKDRPLTELSANACIRILMPCVDQLDFEWERK